MVSAGTAVLNIRPDFAGVQGQVESEGKGIFGGLGGSMAAAFATGFVLTKGVDLFKDSLNEARDALKIQAQTAQVIQTTGGAAGLSAEQVKGLGEKLSGLDGISHNAIQSTENLLLTFTSIKDLGGDKNIFSRATGLVQDMSVAFKEDGKSAAIQLGKALQDPIKGVTALQRVGVSFTADQKNVIAAMVKTGDVAGAQGIILDELAKEVGGSAAAQADPLKKLSVQWDDIKEKLGLAVLPIVNKLAGVLADDLPKAIVFAKDGFHDLEGIVGDVADKFSFLDPIAKDVGSFLGDHLHEIVVSLAAGMAVLGGAAGIGAVIAGLTAIATVIASPIVLIAALAAGLTYAYQESETFRDVVKGAMGIGADAFDGAKDAAVRMGGAVGKAAGDVMNSKLGDLLKDIGDKASKGFDAAKKALDGLIDDVSGGLKTSPTAGLAGGQEAGIAQMRDTLRTAWSSFEDVNATAWTGIRDVGATAWAGIQDDVSTGLAGIGSKVLDFAPHLHQDFQTVWDDVTQLNADSLGVLGKAWDDWISGRKTFPQFIGDIARGGMHVLHDEFQLGTDIVSAVWDMAWQRLYDKATSMMGAVNAVIENGVLDVARTFGGLVLRVDTALGDTHHALLHKGADLILGFSDGVNSVFGAVLGFFEAIPNRIAAAVHNPGGILRSVGQAIVDGLRGGLEDAWSSVTGWFGKAVSGLEGLARGIVGAHSPAKRYELLGGDIGDGLRLGIENSVPGVQSAITSMVSPGALGDMAANARPVTRAFTSEDAVSAAAAYPAAGVTFNGPVTIGNEGVVEDLDWFTKARFAGL